jgi:hypothetical protein
MTFSSSRKPNHAGGLWKSDYLVYPLFSSVQDFCSDFAKFDIGTSRKYEQKETQL